MSFVTAERTLFALAPDGGEHEVVLRVFSPTLQPGGEWGGMVSLGTLQSRPYLICGVDAQQATELGMQFIALRIGHFVTDGWQFYGERGGHVTSASELWPAT